MQQQGTDRVSILLCGLHATRTRVSLVLGGAQVQEDIRGHRVLERQQGLQSVTQGGKDVSSGQGAIAWCDEAVCSRGRMGKHGRVRTERAITIGIQHGTTRDSNSITETQACNVQHDSRS